MALNPCLIRKLLPLNSATVLSSVKFRARLFIFIRQFSSSSSSSLPLYFDDENVFYHSFDPDPFYASLIDNSTHKRHLNQIHVRLLVSGLHESGFLITKLVNKISNFGEIDYAGKVFDEFLDPDVFLWNAIIRCHSRHNFFSDALQLYSRMQRAWVSPDGYTLPLVLKACSGLPSLEMGRPVHGQIFRHGFEADVFVQNGLVAFYAKCGQIARARIIPNVIMWNAMISGYAKNGYAEEAVKLFREMISKNIRADSITVRHEDFRIRSYWEIKLFSPWILRWVIVPFLKFLDLQTTSWTTSISLQRSTGKDHSDSSDGGYENQFPPIILYRA
ncbi:hypothetical protein Q3G72_022906 [Acer saccharum]|nr:hypothetical protein Q3G72_022906 [Acer saccharum]